MKKIPKQCIIAYYQNTIYVQVHVCTRAHKHTGFHLID